MAAAASTRSSVAELVRRRGAGELSREEFFESLASLQLEAVADTALASRPPATSAGCPSTPHVAWVREPVAAWSQAAPAPAAALASPAAAAGYGEAAAASGGGDAMAARGDFGAWRPEAGHRAALHVGGDASARTASASLAASLAGHSGGARCDGHGDGHSGGLGGCGHGGGSGHAYAAAPSLVAEASSPSGAPEGRAERHAEIEAEETGSFMSFAQRNEIWELQRQQRWQEMRRRQQALETVDCRFHPGGGAGQPARISASEAAALADRLARPSATIPRLSLDAARWRERRDKESIEQCTFAPDLSKSSRTYRPRELTAASADTSTCDMTSADAASDDASGSLYGQGRGAESFCGRAPAFAPKTNAVPASMANATAYLEDDVFTRLSRTGQPAQPEACASSPSSPRRRPLGEGHARRYAGLSQDCFSVGSSVIGRSRSETSLAGGGGACSARAGGGGGGATTAFLQRQAAHEEDRQARRAQLEYESAPSHRPELCERSILLVERRQMRGAPTRGLSAGAVEGRVSAGASAGRTTPTECTFRPKITAMARKQTARTVEHLSTGDQKVRDQKLQKARMEKDKREMEGLTFAPEVNDYQGVGSRLRLIAAPDTLLERIEQARNVAKQRCAHDAQRRREKEDAENTFSPEVRRAPEFVRCMAASYRIVQAQREKENQQSLLDASIADSSALAPNGRPDWK